MDHDVRSLQAFIVARFDAVDRRLDDSREQTLRMHEENRAELGEIKEQVYRTNGRMTRAEEQIRTLFERTKGVVSQLSIKWYLTLIATTAAAVYFALIAAGFHR